MNRLILLPVVLISFLLWACSGSSKKEPIDALASHIDSTVKPGDDFFLFANGKWFREHPIPSDEQSNGIFQLIQDTINSQIRNICESSAALKDAPKGSNKQKIGDLFFSGMDSISLNKNGIDPIKPELDRIDQISSLDEMIKMAANIHITSGSPLFSFGVGQDDRISSKNAVFIYQGGISLPDRSYYFDNDSRTVMIRGKFKDYIKDMFMILGNDETSSKKAADQVMKIETSLAKVSRKREDTRDPVKNYNKISFKKLSTENPDINLKLFFSSIGLSRVDTVIVGQPEFLSSLNKFFTSYSLNEWKNYLKFHMINGLSRYLDDKTFMTSFGFYSTVLRGVKEPKPRWKRVVQETDQSLGELIGQVYVSDYLPKGTKEKLLEIGTSIKTVYAEHINNLSWMSDATKKMALSKLNKVIMKVGFPDKWKDLSSLTTDRSSYVRNVINANTWGTNYMISKYGKPVDRTEWGMEPQTYNAYYNPSNNEIVVPGCNIIVPGYERKMADDAILYSIIGGSTFGHEITHGFDDQGCKYDENGNLNNWWTNEDSARFFSKTKMIVRQFNKYIPVDSLHINGELTQGENIADLGGIVMGYEAFKKTSQYKNSEIISGLNPDQRFFLGFALAWMVNERPEAVSNQVKSDVHSPAKFRVIGPLSNIPEFYRTFGMRQGDAMWQPDSLIIKIW